MAIAPGVSLREVALAGGAAGREAERDLLLRCAAEQATSRTTDIRDWDYLIRAAERHGLLPLLGRTAARDGLAPPAPALAHLRSGGALHLAENLRLTGVLRSLVQELEAAGCPCVAFKGPALAAQAYGNVGLRQIADLDLVVRPADVDAADARLRALGFRRELSLSERGERALVQWEHHRGYVSPDETTLLELHWRFAQVRFGLRLDAAPVIARREWIAVGGARIPVPSLDDQVLLLCVHGARHLWERLEWVGGVAALLRVHRPDWSAVLAAASAAGARRLLLTGLALAHGLLHAPLAEPARAALQADPRARALARAAAARLFAEGPSALDVEAKPELFLFNLRAKDGAADRLRFAARYLTTPTEDYWTGPRLPDALFPLYRLYRPFRLAGEYLVSRFRTR